MSFTVSPIRVRFGQTVAPAGANTTQTAGLANAVRYREEKASAAAQTPNGKSLAADAAQRAVELDHVLKAAVTELQGK